MPKDQFINDGYTLQGYIAADEPDGNFDPMFVALSFEYRTASKAEVDALDTRIRRALNIGPDLIARDEEGAIKAVQLGNEFMAAHVKSWDYRDPANHKPDTSAASMGKIYPPQLRERLYLILRGDRRVDKRPAETGDQPTDAEMVGNLPAG